MNLIWFVNYNGTNGCIFWICSVVYCISFELCEWFTGKINVRKMANVNILSIKNCLQFLLMPLGFHSIILRLICIIIFWNSSCNIKLKSVIRLSVSVNFSIISLRVFWVETLFSNMNMDSDCFVLYFNLGFDKFVATRYTKWTKT